MHPNPNAISPLGYLLHDVARLMKRRFEFEAKSRDMTLPQWRALAHLSWNDGMSQVALAGSIETDPMTLSGILDRLEAKGLVERVADPTDSRAKLVQITPKAKALVDDMRSIAGSLYEEVLAGVSPADRQTLISTLTQISSNLSAYSAARKEIQE
jgi:DNA-binding MarR family transcriptional regulator